MGFFIQQVLFINYSTLRFLLSMTSLAQWSPLTNEGQSMGQKEICIELRKYNLVEKVM